MKVNGIGLAAGLLLVLTGILQGQNVKYLSLQDALDYAMSSNYQLLISKKNIESAKSRIDESLAIGFPQISGMVSYNDNFARPTFIFPPFTPDGEEMEIQMGTKYDANIGGTLHQLIFNGKYIVGLKASRVFLDKVTADFFKDKLAVRQQVANAYFNVLSTEAALHIVDTTASLTRKLAEETRKIFDVGFAEDIDVDQLELLVADLEANRVFLENQRGIAYAFLKFYLALDENDSIVLTDDLQTLIDNSRQKFDLVKPFEVEQNAEYVSLEKQKELSQLQVELAKSEYLPTLDASLHYQTQAQRNQWDFFNTHEKWYQSGALGITLNVPIFSSGQRKSKVKQAKIAFDQVNISQKQLINSLNLKYQTAKNEYLNSLHVYQNKDKARKVAGKIYSKTTVKFTQGMASSLDILNTQTQFLNAERDFITASLSLLKAGEELEKLLSNARNQ